MAASEDFVSSNVEIRNKIKYILGELKKVQL